MKSYYLRKIFLLEINGKAPPFLSLYSHFYTFSQINQCVYECIGTILWRLSRTIIKRV